MYFHFLYVLSTKTHRYPLTLVVLSYLCRMLFTYHKNKSSCIKNEWIFIAWSYIVLSVTRHDMGKQGFRRKYCSRKQQIISSSLCFPLTLLCSGCSTRRWRSAAWTTWTFARRRRRACSSARRHCARLRPARRPSTTSGISWPGISLLIIQD